MMGVGESFLLWIIALLVGYVLGHASGLSDFAKIKSFLDKDQKGSPEDA